MTMEDPNSATQPLFTHNCQIKNSLALLIMENGNQKKLISQELVNCLHLITTPCPNPHHLGWVQKDGPRLLVSQHCFVAFPIGQFKDNVLCVVSPLDCSNLLLGVPYQAQRNAIYMAKSNQYKLTKYGHTYILTATTPKPPSTKYKIMHVHLNQCVSLYLVCPVPPNNTTHIVPESMTPLLQESFDVYQTPTTLPPSRHIDHSIHVIPGLALPNAPTY